MRPKKIGVPSPLRVPAISARYNNSMTSLITSMKNRGQAMISRLSKPDDGNETYRLLYKQHASGIFTKIYLSTKDVIIVKEGRVGQKLVHKRYCSSELPRIQAEIEINKAKGYVSLSEYEMDMMDVIFSTDEMIAAECEFFRMEISAHVLDSAVGFYRGQSEHDRKAALTFSVVEFELARSAVSNFIDHSSTAPLCRISRSYVDLDDDL